MLQLKDVLNRALNTSDPQCEQVISLHRTSDVLALPHMKRLALVNDTAQTLYMHLPLAFLMMLVTGQKQRRSREGKIKE